MSAAPTRVVLASASPRRHDLLALIGIAHSVVPADIDERPLADEAPGPHVERLARTKAETVARTETDGALVIAADTVVVVDGGIIGKPTDAAAARVTLRRLAGRTHQVATGMAVAFNGRVASAVETVHVTFRPLDDDEIARYVDTGEPMDKAGSYGIQGFGATIVRRIDGDYFAVMGLSLVRLVDLMAHLGVRYEFGSVTPRT